MINKVTLIGNLGADPEMYHFENGIARANLRLATNESYKDKEGNWQTQTEWHSVVAWRTLAERVEKTLKKGATIYVEGKLSSREWTDKDGNSRRTTEVVANMLRLLDKREHTPEPPTHIGDPALKDMPPPADEDYLPF